jgi:hypothetical protein
VKVGWCIKGIIPFKNILILAGIASNIRCAILSPGAGAGLEFLIVGGREKAIKPLKIKGKIQAPVANEKRRLK